MSWATNTFIFGLNGQYSASPTAASAGATVPLLVDPYGRLVTVQESRAAGANAAGTTWVDSTALACSGMISASGGTLLRVWASNVAIPSEMRCYFQLFDRATAISGGEAPKSVITLYAFNTITVDMLPNGKPFTTGIVWGASTTPDTYTATSGIVWVTAELAR